MVVQIFLSFESMKLYTNDTYAEGTAPQGCDRSADVGAGMAGRFIPPQ